MAAACPFATLGAARGAPLAELRARYTAAALAAHPDKGGSAAAFQAVQRAWEAVRDDAAGGGGGSDSAAAAAAADSTAILDDAALRDFDFAGGAGGARLACRCGDAYALDARDVARARAGAAVVVACAGCSLRVRVAAP